MKVHGDVREQHFTFRTLNLRKGEEGKRTPTKEISIFMVQLISSTCRLQEPRTTPVANTLKVAFNNNVQWLATRQLKGEINPFDEQLLIRVVGGGEERKNKR